MPKVNVDFSQAGEGGGNYDRVPPGYYRIQCIKSSYQKSQAGDSNIIWTEWRIRGPQNVGGKILQVFSMKPQATWSLRNCLIALGFNVPQAKRAVDTDALLRKECGARIGDGEMTNRTTGRKMAISEIKEFLSLADYEQQRTPSRNGAPSVAQAVKEADALEAETEFEYEDPEEGDQEEEVEEITL